MPNILTNRLLEFEKELAGAQETDYKNINIASEFGLGHQEVKHSTFLSHLFDPYRKSYRLVADGNGSKAYFLRIFFKTLEKYKVHKPSAQIDRNLLILQNGSGTGQSITEKNIEAFGRAKDLVVRTERIGEDGDKSRIDILVISQLEKCVLVIENKVFSSTHDDQLRNYETRYLDPSWKKVFVYLTPHGDLPKNMDGTDAVNWCVFDYVQLKTVIEKYKNLINVGYAGKPITNLKGDNKKRLIFALEDYMENIKMEVLKEAVEANEKLGKLLETYPDIIQRLIDYKYSARPLYVAEYCKKTMKATAVGESAVWFYTKRMEAFFLNHGEEIEDKMFVVCQGKGGNKNADSIEIYLERHTKNNNAWSPAQLLIINDPAIKKLQTKVSIGKQDYRILSGRTLLADITDSNGNYKPFDAVNTILDQNLKQFIDDIQKFEDCLDTI